MADWRAEPVNEPNLVKLASFVIFRSLLAHPRRIPCAALLATGARMLWA